jgi:hypothetical protein
LESFFSAVRARPSCPAGLESPLDDGVERLGPKRYCSQFNKILQPLAEGGTFFVHSRSCFGGRLMLVVWFRYVTRERTMITFEDRYERLTWRLMNLADMRRRTHRCA